MTYESIAEWLGDIASTLEGDYPTPGLNFADGEENSSGVFIEANIATLNDYIDGSAEKAVYITARFYLPYVAGDEESGRNINSESMDFVACVMDKIRRIELLNEEPGYPDLGEGKTVVLVEALDNDPTLESVDDEQLIGCYSFQLRIIYLSEV